MKIQAAEAWRVAGERLHRLSPEVFERVFHFLAVAAVGVSDEPDDSITESYLLT